MIEIVFNKNKMYEENHPSAVAKALFEKEGLAAIINANPDLRILEVVGYDGIDIPDSIGTLDKLYNFVLEGANNLPDSIRNCKNLELLSLARATGNIDIRPLKDLEKLIVLNITSSPHIVGIEELNEDNVLLVNA
jgi:hypothetical protein